MLPQVFGFAAFYVFSKFQYHFLSETPAHTFSLFFIACAILAVSWLEPELSHNGYSGTK